MRSPPRAFPQRDRDTIRCPPGWAPSAPCKGVDSESTGTYGAKLLLNTQNAGLEILEITPPDQHDRRRRGKNEDREAQIAAQTALAGKRTITPRSRDGTVEFLRVIKASRKPAVATQRIALQRTQNTIVCAPDSLRGVLRGMTRMLLVRTMAAWRPDQTDHRNAESA